MTEIEFQQQILRAIPDFWPSCQLPPGKVRNLWDRLGRYSVSDVLNQFRRASQDDMDSRAPKWQVIFDRLANERGGEIRTGWSVTEECQFAYLQAQYWRQHKNAPADEYIIHHQMHRELPTEQQREAARQKIREAYPVRTKLNPEWQPTLPAISAIQRQQAGGAQ